jgi:hypothetical protein
MTLDVNPSKEEWKFALKWYLTPYYRMIATLMKHEKYSVEKEIRYVVSFEAAAAEALAKIGRIQIEYRHGGLVPIIAIELDKVDLKISKIFVGPHLNSIDERENNLLERSIKRHFSHHHATDVGIDADVDPADAIEVKFSQLKLRC